MAKRKRYGNVYVEEDSKLVIDMVTGISATPWKLKKIITDINYLVVLFKAISWKHVFIEENFVADVVTSLGFKSTNSYIWDRMQSLFRPIV